MSVSLGRRYFQEPIYHKDNSKNLSSKQGDELSFFKEMGLRSLENLKIETELNKYK